MATTNVLCTLNVLLALTSIFSNAVVFLAIVRTPQLHNPSNVLLCNLALSDLGVGLFVQPLFVAYISGWHRSSLMYIAGMASVYFTGASIVTMTCVAVDRCLALYLHMRYHVIVTIRRTVVIVTVMWVGDALSLGIFYIGDPQFANGVVATFCLINFSIVTACYLNIYRTVKRHKRQINDQMRAINAPRIKQGRSIITMLYIHVIFIICLIPFALTIIYYIATRQNDAVTESISVFCTGTLVFMSSAINPYLYCWRMSDIRKAVKKLFNNLRCREQ